jgi:hypothetical protein
MGSGVILAARLGDEINDLLDSELAEQNQDQHDNQYKT